MVFVGLTLVFDVAELVSTLLEMLAPGVVQSPHGVDICATLVVLSLVVTLAVTVTVVTGSVIVLY